MQLTHERLGGEAVDSSESLDAGTLAIAQRTNQVVVKEVAVARREVQAEYEAGGLTAQAVIWADELLLGLAGFLEQIDGYLAANTPRRPYQERIDTETIIAWAKRQNEMSRVS